METSTVLEMVEEINAKAQRRDSAVDPENEVDMAAREKAVKHAQARKKAHEMENLVGLLTGIQFAVVILIAQRRIPEAQSAEFFVVLSMLMITAANARIIAYLPDGSNIQSDYDAIKFLVMGVPVFLFMIVIELWFIAYLFSYDPNEQLKAFKDNAEKVLIICKTLSILKLSLVIVLIAMPRFLGRIRKILADRAG